MGEAWGIQANILDFYGPISYDGNSLARTTDLPSDLFPRAENEGRVLSPLNSLRFEKCEKKFGKQPEDLEVGFMKD